MTYAAFLFDGSNALHRAAHVARPLTTTIDGAEVPIGAVYQTIRMVLAEVDRHGSAESRVFVAWEGDRDGTSWRRDLFPGYKADRDPNRHGGDLQRQEVMLRDALSDLGWPQVWSPGFEADDTLATLAVRLVERGIAPVAIITGDRDLHQCVTERVHVLSGSEVWTPDKVRDKWGVPPTRIPEVKAIVGDKSDGIPGVKGIGDTGAAELLSKWGSLDAAIAGVAEAVAARGQVPALYRKLHNGNGAALLFRQITTVRVDAPLVFAPRKKIAPREVFERFRFASLCAPSWLRIAERIAGR